MAATVEARRLTEAHRLAQTRLGATTIRQSLAAWALLNPDDINGTLEQWLAVMVPLVQGSRRTSARLAANYLTTFRSLELGLEVGRFVPELVEEIPAEQVATSLIVTGPATVRANRGPMARVVDTARAKAASAAMRHVLNGGRDTVIASVNADRRALGWARATSGRACSFCAMLAGRGPVYGEDTVGFQAHDHCSCSTEPVYRRDAAWPPGSERYQALWRDAKAADGDTVANFRRLVASG